MDFKWFPKSILGLIFIFAILMIIPGALVTIIASIPWWMWMVAALGLLVVIVLKFKGGGGHGPKGGGPTINNYHFH